MAHYHEVFPDSGPVKQEFFLENDGGRLTVVSKSSQEVQPIIDEVKAYGHLMEVQGKFRVPGVRRNYTMAAKIPVVEYYRWMREWKTRGREHWTWNTFKTMKLNDRDYSRLRVDGKKV